MTFIVLTLIAFYAVIKFDKLEKRDDTDVMISRTEDYFDASYVFDVELVKAFGITVYDGNQEPIDDDTYGRLKAEYKTWGGLIPGKSVDFERLPTRRCTEAELHINGQSDENSLFFKPQAGSVGDMSFYWKKLQCVDFDAITRSDHPTNSLQV